MIITGSSLLGRADSIGLTQIISKIAGQTNAEEGWKVMNTLHSNSSQVAALDLGYKPGVFVFLIFVRIQSLVRTLSELRPVKMFLAEANYRDKK